MTETPEQTEPHEPAGQNELTEQHGPGTENKIPGFGCFGWGLLVIGVVFFARNYWLNVWDWVLLGLGCLFYVYGITRDRQYFFPGTILVVTSGGLLLRNLGILDFPLWKFWPLLFISIGIALMVMWIAREIRSWVIFPAGILLIAGGFGFGEQSWWNYQHWLRKLVDHWVLLLIVFCVLLLLSFWRRYADKSASDSADHQYP